MQPENTGDLQEKRDGKGRFVKGVSGNPEGKPKGSVSIVAKIKEELAKTPEGQKASYLEALVKQILRKAIVEGNEGMIKLIVSYIDGMPKQTMALDARVEEVEVDDRDPRVVALYQKVADEFDREYHKILIEGKGPSEESA